MKNKNIIPLLKQVRKRATGKTTLLQKGVQNYDYPFMLVCKNMHQGKSVVGKNKNAKLVIDTTDISGYDLPIIFDQEVVADYLMEICELRSEVEKLNERIEKIKTSEIVISQ